jgi:hypothetical protein
MSTDTTRTFRLFSIETGHDFGVWEASDVSDALDALRADAGFDIDASLVECIELTAASFAGRSDDYMQRVIKGLTIDGEDGRVSADSVLVEQDWDAGETLYHFPDGTTAVASGPDPIEAR